MTRSSTPGCGAGCGLFLVTAAATLLYLRTVRPTDEVQLVVALVAGGLAGTLAISVLTLVRSSRMLRALRDAAEGVIPPLGEYGAFSGTIHADEPLRAPISGREVVAYQYEVWEPGRAGSSSTGTRGTTTCFRGSALSPSALRTASGTLPLLVYPGTASIGRLDSPTAHMTFRDYVSRTSFVVQVSLDERLLAGRSHRQDLDCWGHHDKQWDRMSGFEGRVDNGDEVTIFGFRTEEGIAHDPEGKMPMRIERTVEARRELRKERRQAITGLIMAPLMIALILFGYVVLLPMVE